MKKVILYLFFLNQGAAKKDKKKKKKNGFPQNILRFNILLEEFTELMEIYYTHSYV